MHIYNPTLATWRTTTGLTAAEAASFLAATELTAVVAPFITAAEVLGLPVDGAAPRLAVVGAASLCRTPLYLRELDIVAELKVQYCRETLKDSLDTNDTSLRRTIFKKGRKVVCNIS